MKLARYMSLVALAMAVAFLMAVVPSAPKSASAQGPATRFECNYVTMSSKLTETALTTESNPNNSTGSQSGVTTTGNTGTTGTTAVAPRIGNNRCLTVDSALKVGDNCYLNAALTADVAAYETYTNRDVLFSISGTGSFSGIANRRQLKGRVTSFITEGDAAASGTTPVAIKTRHVVEFDNYSVQDGVCDVNEMCFIALGEGTIVDYPAGNIQAYDQNTANNDNLNISIAVTSGRQQLASLCGRLTNSRNNSTSQTIGTNNGAFGPDATPDNGQLQSRSELSKLNGNSLVFNMAGALCECQTNKSGPLDYGVQNNQGQ